MVRHSVRNVKVVLWQNEKRTWAKGEIPLGSVEAPCSNFRLVQQSPLSTLSIQKQILIVAQTPSTHIHPSNSQT
jgi:hypothetical protein